MFGVLLTALSSIFQELGTAIGKHEHELKHEDIFSMGFINTVVGTGVFIAIAYYGDPFVLSPASYPTLALRIILELILTYLTLIAIINATRSTFSFFRTITIPLLLVIDWIVGYTISDFQTAGIIIILLTLWHLHYADYSEHKGQKVVIATAVLASATIGLYKYNITFFNSVTAEQTIVMTAKILFLLLMAIFIKKHNPFKIFVQPWPLVQGLSSGIATALISYAYLFSPASIIMGAQRTLSVVAGVFSGHYYFKEKNLGKKVIHLILIGVGIILLSIN